MAHVVERQLRWFWRFVTMPVLFGLVGATVSFAALDRAVIAKACAIIFAGAPLRATALLSWYWKRNATWCRTRASQVNSVTSVTLIKRLANHLHSQALPVDMLLAPHWCAKLGFTYISQDIHIIKLRLTLRDVACA